MDLYDIFYAIVNDTLSKRMVIDKIPALADQLKNRKRPNNTHMDKSARSAAQPSELAQSIKLRSWLSCTDKTHSLICRADLYMFLETASFREDLKAFLAEQPEPGPDAFDLRIQHVRLRWPVPVVGGSVVVDLPQDFLEALSGLPLWT